MPSNKPFMPVLPLLLFLAALLAAPAGAAPLSEADQQCLGCHGQPGLAKTFGNVRWRRRTKLAGKVGAWRRHRDTGFRPPPTWFGPGGGPLRASPEAPE